MNIEVNSQPQKQTSQNSAISELEICFRCPHCHKLYKTSTDVFDSGDAEFDCSACSKAFLLKKEQDSFGLYKTSDLGVKSFATCPKCSHLKPDKSDECPSCGVLASKYLELQKLESPVLFELNQQWQKVLLNFDQDQYHQDFINKCHLKLALNFAFQKYSDLQKTMGFDSLCEKYIRQIELRIEQQFRATESISTEEKQIFQPLSLVQYLFIGIGVIGMIMLIYNKFIPTFPNFNGIVLVLTMTAFAIGLFSNNKSGVGN